MTTFAGRLPVQIAGSIVRRVPVARSEKHEAISPAPAIAQRPISAAAERVNASTRIVIAPPPLPS
jgi:hypothetical protein